MERFFSIFGKVILIVLIFGTVAYGSYYMGQNGKNGNTKTTNSYQTETSLTPTTSPLSPSPTPVLLKTVLGGVDKKAGLSFTQYSLQVPGGWVEERESQTPSDEKLILKKDGYEISIFQAATGGALCLYPGDAEFEGPSSTYTIFTDLKTKDGLTLRRSGTNTLSKDGKTGFTMCQKSNDDNFGQPTNYGHMSLTLPKDYLETTLSEMDQIISSLVKR